MEPSNVDQTSRKGTITSGQTLVLELPSVQDDDTVHWNVEVSCGDRSLKTTMKLLGGEVYYIVPKDENALDLGTQDYKPLPDWTVGDPDD